MTLLLFVVMMEYVDLMMMKTPNAASSHNIRFQSGNGKNWIATVTLESSTYKYPDNDAEKNDRKNEDRMDALHRIIQFLAKTYPGTGIVLFPGGYFHSGTDGVTAYIPTVVDAIEPFLRDVQNTTSSSVVVCLGVDGRVLLNEGPEERYDANQVSIAISKDGLIAYGKKFYPTDDIEARVVDLAADYVSPEKIGNTQYSRIFSHAERSFYLAECNDIKGLRNYPKPDSVDGILNCVHGCYNRNDGPTCSYFVRLNFGGASKDWRCPVFGAAVFFKRKIAEKWRTGMFYRMWDRDPIQCETDENSLTPIQTYSSFLLAEGLAQVDLYDLDQVFSGNPLYRAQLDNTQSRISAGSHTGKRIERHKPAPVAVSLYEGIRNGLDGLLGTTVIDQSTKFTYRGKNTIGYPGKKEIDMISLFKPSSTKAGEIKFRIYPHVLAGLLDLINQQEILGYLPAGSIVKFEREKPHPAEVFIEGRFTSMSEVEQFLLLIKQARI